MNGDGIYCNLITGQEKKIVPFAQHSACTIEMANLSQSFEVVVIDEIQVFSFEILLSFFFSYYGLIFFPDDC